MHFSPFYASLASYKVFLLPLPLPLLFPLSSTSFSSPFTNSPPPSPQNYFEIDIYLRLITSSLLPDIRKKAIIDFFSPFSCVKLEYMAEMFGCGVGEIEKEVVGLIEGGWVGGRVDKEHMVFFFFFFIFIYSHFFFFFSFSPPFPPTFPFFPFPFFPSGRHLLHTNLVKKQT